MNDTPRWITTSAAASLLGVNPRAVQKRAARGSIPARRIGTGAAARWEIDADALDASTGPQMDAPASTNGRISHAPDVQSAPKADASNVHNGRVQGVHVDASNVADLREQLARERGEVAFLRGLVEQHQRSEAELRASLREALRAMPKAITAGDTPQTARDAPESPQTGGAGNDTRKGTRAPQAGAEARERPLTYGDIADELERSLNQ